MPLHNLAQPFPIPLIAQLVFNCEDDFFLIACASFEPEGAPVFDLNGRCEKLEDGLAIVKEMAPEAKISCEGSEFPFPADLDESDLRAFVPDYPAISLREGVMDTYNGFAALKADGRLPKLPE